MAKRPPPQIRPRDASRVAPHFTMIFHSGTRRKKLKSHHSIRGVEKLSSSIHLIPSSPCEDVSPCLLCKAWGYINCKGVAKYFLYRIGKGMREFIYGVTDKGYVIRKRGEVDKRTLREKRGGEASYLGQV